MTDISVEINQESKDFNVNLLRPGLVSPWVDVRDYSSFSAAIDAIGLSEKTLLIPNQQGVTANKTVPSNVCVQFLKGGYLNISNGITVTFNQRPESGRYKIFKLTGTAKVEFGSDASVDIYPEWWGTE